MSRLKDGSASATFAFANIFLMMSLALMAVAFSTNYWKDIYIDRKALISLGVNADRMNAAIYYTRHRGLFRTCYPEEASFLDKLPNLVDGKCLSETGYEIPTRNPDTLAYGTNYEMKMHIQRAWFAGFVMAMFFVLVSSIVATFACMKQNAALMRSTGILVFIAMLFCAGGMVSFHVVHFLEERILTNVPDTIAYIRTQALSDLKLARLNDKTVSTFGFSYILAWLGLGFSAISGIMYLIVAYKFVVKANETYGIKRSRNRAYDYMDRNPYGPDAYGPDPYDRYGAAYPVREIACVDSAPYDVYSGYRY